jgi:branched-chain amino acid transport system substrate-binding protein
MSDLLNRAWRRLLIFPAAMALSAAILVTSVAVDPASAKVDCPIKIGSVRPESGAGASFGQSLARGLEMGFPEVNAKGGIAGCQVQLIAYDSQSLPANAATLTNRLINQDRVALILGSSISTETLAMMEITEIASFPLYVPSAASAKITNQGAKWVWRQSVIDLSAARLFAEYLAKDLRYKQVGAIYENTDYGRAPVQEVLKSELEKHGSKLVLAEAFNVGDPDLSSQLLRLRDAKVDGIVYWGHEKEGALLVRQNIQLGINLPVAGNTGIVYPAFLELLSADAQAKTNLVAVTQFVWTNKDPAQSEWKAKFKARYGKDPDVTSMDGYDAAFVIKKVIEMAGSTDPEALKKAFSVVKYDGVGGSIAYDATGQAVRSLMMVKLTPKTGLGFEVVKVVRPGQY